MSRQVLDQYLGKVARGDLRSDAAQEGVASRLDDLSARLAEHARKPGGWGRLLGLKAAADSPKGLYIVGGVGRGKTMLMDMFFDAAPIEQKRRVHFHAFMVDVHARIHEWRQASRRGAAKGEEPIGPVAADLAAEAQLLCFDEFAVTDIADAMILGRLFTALFADKVTVVTTSNVEPADLYKDGLNRTSFLPFIALLEDRMEVVRLDAGEDFRYAKLAGATMWFTPPDARATAAIDRLFLDLTGVAAGHPTSLRLLGRSIGVPQAAGGVARFSFAAICEAPFGAADYLTLAKAFGTIVIDGIRIMRTEERNLVKRFITMVDTFYDEQVKLIFSAEVAPEALYGAKDGREAFEFARTISRLQEMRSADYLARPHGHGRPTGNSSGLVET